MKSSSRSKGRVITVKVTQKNIDKGLKGNCDLCPIALALLSNNRRISSSVDGCSAFFTTKANKTFEGWLPKRARSFIRKFDGSHKVKPFSFRLAVFTPSL